MKDKITGIVLAGGKSSRMGQNKALLNYQEKKMFEHAIEKISPYCQQIFISGDFEEYKKMGYNVVNDRIKSIGPIGGLYSSLIESKTYLNIVIACDVPLIASNAFELLINEIENYDAAVLKTPDGKIEPLIGIYTKNALPVIKKQIAGGNYKMMHLLRLLNSKYAYYLNTNRLKNINTIEDYNKLSYE